MAEQRFVSWCPEHPEFVHWTDDPPPTDHCTVRLGRNPEFDPMCRQPLLTGAVEAVSE